MLSERLLPLFRSSVALYCLNAERLVVLSTVTSTRPSRKFLHTSPRCFQNTEAQKKEKPKQRSTAVMSPFEATQKRERQAFLDVLRQYKQRPGPRTDAVAFIKLALKYMDEFGVNKDLEVYKQLLDVFPKGPLVAKNSLQVIFFHRVKEQFSAVEVLKKMEVHGVCPDVELQTILINTFGKWALPVMKCHRLTYWFPKFKWASPWLVPNPLPTDTLELVKEIIKRITSADPQNVVTVYLTEDVEDALENTWIVSAMAPAQKDLLKKHNPKEALFVEGPFRSWLGDKNIEYFILRAKPPKDGYDLPDLDPDDVSKIRNPYVEVNPHPLIMYPTVHEQQDGIIMSTCATGTSSKDSLLSWIRCLQKENPVLKNIPIVFTLRRSADDPMYISDSTEPRQIAEKI